jgi:tetratricopeptide (TPR) repeat protein
MHYIEAYKMNDRDVALLTNMSAACMALKRYEDAADVAHAATMSDPTWAKGWYRHALALEASGDLRRAVEVLEDGLDNIGENEQMRALYVKLAFMYEEDELSAAEMKERGNEALKRGKIPAAVEWYTRGIAKSGTSNEVLTALYNNRAECRRREYQHEKVISDCKEVLKLDSNNIKANLRMAVAYEQLEKFADAIEAYERLLKLDAKDTHQVRERITRCRVSERYMKN